MHDHNPPQTGVNTSRLKLFVMILITVMVIVLMLLAVEAAVRVRQYVKFGSTATLESYYTVDPELNLRVPVANYSSGRISINSLGFRGPEIEVPKPPATVRVAFLGASTTWCGEVSSNSTVWPHLVIAALKRTFPGTQFDYVNGGVPGYFMESILKNLTHRVAPLQPDVVVVYEGANNLSGELRELAVQRGIIETSQVQESSWAGRHSLLWYLVEKNFRVLTAQREAQTSRNRLEVDPAILGKEYRQGLTQVVLAARQTAKLVAVATFSTQLRREQSPEVQLSASASALFYAPFATPRLLLDSYGRYNQIMREVARETGAFLIEGENEIPGDALHFTDTVHFSDAGSNAMAERISRSLAASPVLREIVAARTAAR